MPVQTRSQTRALALTPQMKEMKAREEAREMFASMSAFSKLRVAYIQDQRDEMNPHINADRLVNQVLLMYTFFNRHFDILFEEDPKSPWNDVAKRVYGQANASISFILFKYAKTDYHRVTQCVDAIRTAKEKSIAHLDKVVPKWRFNALDYIPFLERGWSVVAIDTNHVIPL